MRIGEITVEKRARNVAIVGLLLHVALGLCLLVLYLFNHSAATFAASRLMFGGLFIWVVLVVLYQQRRRVAQESLETERLRQERTSGGSESIFEMEEEEFLVSQRRLIYWFKTSSGTAQQQAEELFAMFTGGTFRSYSLALDWPFHVACVVFAARALWLLRRDRHVPGHCQRCGYNLTGLTEARCPECGAGFAVRRRVGSQDL